MQRETRRYCECPNDKDLRLVLLFFVVPFPLMFVQLVMGMELSRKWRTLVAETHSMWIEAFVGEETVIFCSLYRLADLI